MFDNPSAARAFSWARRAAVRGALAAASLAAVARTCAQSIPAVELESVIVTAMRAPQAPGAVAATTLQFDVGELRDIPVVSLDNALRTTPAFSLFRRSDSLTANPTAQGVSLRGLGPSGASRSLVLLDGMPLNDPFGGWVAWSKVPRDALASIEVVPGGGASAWGNSALGGVVQLLSHPAATASGMSDGRVSVFGGDFATFGAGVALTQAVGPGVAQVFAEHFSTEGFPIVREDRRGPADTRAWSRHRTGVVRWRMPLGKALTVLGTVRGFEETRGNGTAYQRNASREKFASLQAYGEHAADFSWEAAAYVQTQTYASTFSAINAARTAETPASDQFAVPAAAAGLSWLGTRRGADGMLLSFGADARGVRGETRERYSYMNGAFTRQRIAGGRQMNVGLFANHQRPLARTVTLNAGLRLDRWSDDRGRRTETLLASGAATREEAYPKRDGIEASPSAGVVWRPEPAWKVHGNVQRAFRRPTLNELYRPFRQGPNVVEANPALRTENATSAEFGVWWQPGARQRTDRNAGWRSGSDQEKAINWGVGATAFWNELRDAVSNVTLARGPGTFPLFGNLPPGGTGRQRLNVERIRVQGIELSTRLQVGAALQFQAAYLYDDATVRRTGSVGVESGTASPKLEGKRLAQVPEHAAVASATWRTPHGMSFTPRVRWIGRQFDDDENTLRLGAAVVADVGVTLALRTYLDVFLNVENLTDTAVETARTADGVVSIGTPRFVFGGLRARW